MSTAATPKALPRLGLTPEKGSEILGVLLGALVLLLAGSLVSYDPGDPSVFHRVADESGRTQNFIGPFGAQIAALCFAFLGLTSFLLPVLLGLAAWRRLTKRKVPQVAARTLGLLALFPALPAMFQLLLGEVAWRGAAQHAGGAMGVVIVDILSSWLAPGGAFVVLLTLLVVGGSLVARSSLGELVEAAKDAGGVVVGRAQLRIEQHRKRRREEDVRQRVLRHARQSVTTEVRSVPAAGREMRGRSTRPASPRDGLDDLPLRGGHTGASVAEAPGAPDETLARTVLPPVSDVRVTERKGEGHFAVRKIKSPAEAEPVAAGGPSVGGPSARRPERRPPEARTRAVTIPKAEPVPQQEMLAFTPEELEAEELPPVNLLRTDVPTSAHDEDALVRRAQIIRESFEHFGIAGTVEGISPGPVITVYEFQPAPGIKVSRIVNLQDDLALALKAESVRIERLPGRSTLGLEVPNAERSIIRLGRLFEDEKFINAPSPLTIALGVDIYGRPHYGDLAKMPHLLVAGATGAGKSVGLQSMITSILYKATKDQVKFIFIDPKRIELGVYADIPHLKAPVVVEPQKAANALRWAVAEMERRYRLLAEVHVRSIDYYNRAIGDPKERERLSLKEGESEFRAEDFKPLPYYVIIIDELADLMMVASSDVEASIARLAQMARAVGIHLIVATQRPSVDVLTGTIKANFPCRLSFATATRHDSRTILDQVGAEKLLGKGDALFVPQGTSRVQRLHGAYITEQETAALIRWLKRRGKPELDLTVLEAPEGESDSGGGSGGGGDDDLFDEAARLVVNERMGSASFLQRRLRVGFSRAARLIDMLEADGLLGPAQGSKPRDVLVPPDYFDELARARQGIEE